MIEFYTTVRVTGRRRPAHARLPPSRPDDFARLPLAGPSTASP